MKNCANKVWGMVNIFQMFDTCTSGKQKTHKSKLILRVKRTKVSYLSGNLNQKLLVLKTLSFIFRNSTYSVINSKILITTKQD